MRSCLLLLESLLQLLRLILLLLLLLCAGQARLRWRLPVQAMLGTPSHLSPSTPWPCRYPCPRQAAPSWS